ncbi:hypothetical protein FRC16_006172 [Serendipita sp. 398]|nr:hypothetical protein FRC16_006172 [Serendipita sp. 398]
MWSASYASPPPYQAHTSSPRLTMLSIDGGGTRPICVLHILCEIMYRLSWDLGNITSRRCTTTPHIYPADCFDYIGGGGTGALVSFLLACGATAEEARDTFLRLAPQIKRVRSITDLQLLLQSTTSGCQTMRYRNECIIDIPSRTNIWIPSDTRQEAGFKGILIKKGKPVITCLLPLVATEIYKELTRQTKSSHYTLPFLQDVCPNTQNCSLLLSLGSISSPSRHPPTVSSSMQTGSMLSQWLSPYFPSSCSPVSWMATPAVAQHQIPESNALERYIPPSAWGRTVIRLEPNLAIWNALGERRWPDEWEDKQFGEHKMLTKNYCSKADNEGRIDVVINILRASLLPGYSMA